MVGTRLFPQIARSGQRTGSIGTRCFCLLWRSTVADSRPFPQKGLRSATEFAVPDVQALVLDNLRTGVKGAEHKGEGDVMHDIDRSLRGYSLYDDVADIAALRDDPRIERQIA